MIYGAFCYCVASWCVLLSCYSVTIATRGMPGYRRKHAHTRTRETMTCKMRKKI